MLDDLRMMHERDAQDALGIAERQWQQLDYDFRLPDGFKPGRITNVVYAGMGGSAQGGQIARAWLDLSIPFEVVSDYDVPAYVGPHTLFVAASYSGNTEETLSALKQAHAKGAVIVILAAGGKLLDVAKQENHPLLQIPANLQPRFTAWFFLKAVVTVFDSCGLTKGRAAEMVNQQAWLRECIGKWRPEAATAHNEAKQIARELMGKSIVVYAGPKLFPAAYRWKISFNENAKHIAWCGQYPEFNHNEFIGWSKQPVSKPYAIIDLRSDLEHAHTQKRFQVTERLLSGMRPAPIIIKPQGDTLLQQLLYAIALGSFVSLYLALLNGINPTPVDLVEKFKASLRDA